MAKLTVQQVGAFDVPAEMRLVNAADGYRESRSASRLRGEREVYDLPGGVCFGGTDQDDAGGEGCADVEGADFDAGFAAELSDPVRAGHGGGGDLAIGRVWPEGCGA